MSLEFTSEKDEIQTKLFQAESKVINLETNIREMKIDYESKITHLESTVAAKDVHIKQLVQYFVYGVDLSATARLLNLVPLVI